MRLLTILAFLACSQVATADQCYIVGTWNIEHFKHGAKRGFPEQSGHYAARTQAQIGKLAKAIDKTIDFKLLALQEINGVSGQTRSKELNDLVSKLGNHWKYRIALSGKKQRVAFLWDTRFVKLNSAHEIVVPPKYVPKTGNKKKDIFDRDPLVGHFTFLKDGQEMNDLTFVALHLASGQFRTKNHDTAMAILKTDLASLKGDASYPANENDILLAGDFNASWYDKHRENFFDRYNKNGWKVMALKSKKHNSKGYPDTRVNGSQIDYLIATTKSNNGLIGQEIQDGVAIVHQGLAKYSRETFRDDYSDHFPVTTCVSVTSDTD